MIRRLLSILSYFLLLAALVGFGAAGYLYFVPEDAPGATIEEPNREFPSLTVGTNEVRFRLQNPTRHAIRVVGYQFC